MSNFIILTPKGTTLARTTNNDVLRVRVWLEMRSVIPVKQQKQKTTETVMCQTTYLFIPSCMWGPIQELVIYYEF